MIRVLARGFLLHTYHPTWFAELPSPSQQSSSLDGLKWQTWAPNSLLAGDAGDKLATSICDDESQDDSCFFKYRAFY